MVFFKYKRKRRRFSSRHLSLARKALRKVNKLAKQLKPEWKSIDSIQPATTLNNVGLITNISDMIQGDDNDERVGIKVKCVRLNGIIEADKGSGTLNTIRTIIFVDKRQNIDTKPTLAEVLNTVSVYSGLNADRVKRFKILLDRVVRLRTNRITQLWRFSKNIDVDVGFNGPLGTDLESNHIYILSLSDQSANLPSFQYDIRLYFTDT